ncbi:site-specific integrase [bacterium]|nr:site-specific integrase [bacterium]
MSNEAIEGLERESLLKQEKARNWYVDDFLRFMARRGRAQRTLAEYSDDLRIFIEFYQKEFSSGMVLADFDDRTVSEFLDYLQRNRDYTPKGLNRKIACLRSYFVL